MASPTGIFKAEFGREPESQFGTLENIEMDNLSVKRSTYVAVCSPGTYTLMLSYRWPSEEPGSQVSLFKDLWSAIRKATTPAVKWEESTAVIEMIELAHQSAREGRTVEVSKK